MIKKLITVFLSLILCLSLFSCEKAAPSAKELLGELCDGLRLPAGEVYFMGACEGEDGYMPEDTARIIYGDSFISDTMPKLSDFALYLSSFPTPYEAAVFICHSRSDTDSLLSVCLERKDTLSVLLRGTEYASLPQNARIFAKGRCVAMVLSDDPELAERFMRKAMA